MPKQTDFIDKPTPAVLALIKTAQQKRWEEINAKPKWSERDFEEALFCHNEYRSELGEWYYSEETIKKLAFDARTPNRLARQLQDVAKQMIQPKA